MNSLRLVSKFAFLAAGLLACASEGLAQSRVISLVPTGNTPPAIEIGAYTPEGPRLREQLWLVPTTPAGPPRLRATVFRPAGGGPFPLAVVNHTNMSAAVDRLGLAMPTFFFLSRLLVARGYAVILPLRRNYGGSEGTFDEAIGQCAAPDYGRAGAAASQDIEATIDFMMKQTFIRPGKALVVGVGGGGWGALALAARAPEKVAAVIGFGAGRGAAGPTRPGEVCAPERLQATARHYGAAGRVPVLLLHAEDDRNIGLEAARAMADAYVAGGGNARFVATKPVGDGQGANMINELRAIPLWKSGFDTFLSEQKL